MAEIDDLAAGAVISLRTISPVGLKQLRPRLQAFVDAVTDCVNEIVHGEQH